VLAAMVQAGRAAPAFELAERRRARELLERLTQAEALRADSGPTGAVPGHVREPVVVTAEAAAAALPDERTALLEYVAGLDGAPSTVFVVTRRGVQARVLPPADSLISTIERFVALLEDGQDPREPAGVLGPVLLDSALALLSPGVTRILVVPDGPLHRLPFDALRLTDGRYLVERYTVGVVPSAGALATLRQRPVRPDTQGTAVLALGDPAFAREQGDPTARGELFRDAFDRSGGLPRLVAAGDEVREVARYAPAAVVRVRGDASEAFVKHTPLERFGVLHFATHALVDEATLARTALALSPGDGEDGFLSPADLAALRLNADLVVLSACRTAGGVIVAGEGLQGLTAPLLEAGARSVVATQWRIGDRSTVQLVDDFYEAMAGGRPVAEALRTAKLAAIRRGAPPRDWAAFTVVGDPESRVKLSQPAPLPSLWWVAAAGAALVLGGLLVRRGGRGRSLTRRQLCRHCRRQDLVPYPAGPRQHDGRIAAAVRRVGATHAAVVAQQRRGRRGGGLKVPGQDQRSVANVAVHVDQVLRVAQPRAGMERHHLHQTLGADRAGGLGLEGRVLGEEHRRDERRRHLLPAGLPQHRAADPPHQHPVVAVAAKIGLERSAHGRRRQLPLRLHAVQGRHQLAGRGNGERVDAGGLDRFRHNRGGRLRHARGQQHSNQHRGAQLTQPRHRANGAVHGFLPCVARRRRIASAVGRPAPCHMGRHVLG